MMEKQGVINENTPDDQQADEIVTKKACCGGSCHSADRKDHAANRLGDAIEVAIEVANDQ